MKQIRSVFTFNFLHLLTMYLIDFRTKRLISKKEKKSNTFHVETVIKDRYVYEGKKLTIFNV